VKKNEPGNRRVGEPVERIEPGSRRAGEPERKTEKKKETFLDSFPRLPLPRLSGSLP
jgi:hypothetical protein